MSLQGVPVIVLGKDSKRTQGRDAMNSNITAVLAVAELLKSSLGPRGMDKMLVDSLGDVTITNDGAEIVKKIETSHPAAKIVIQTAKSQDSEAGDGTTSVVVMTGELLKKAKELLDKGVHPSVIVNGYNKATEEAVKYLHKIAISINGDTEAIKKVAMTTMNSKVVSASKEALADLVVKAVTTVAEEKDGKPFVNLDYIKIVKKEGEDTSASQLVKGVVLDKEVGHSDMPRKVENAKILLLNVPIEIEKTEYDANIRIDSPDDMFLFKKQEEKMVEQMVEKIAKTGANVVFAQKNISDLALYFMAKRGIVAVKRVSKNDMKRLSKATGAKFVSNLDEIPAESLGEAGLVEERKVADSKFVFIENCKDPKAVTLFLRGGTKLVVEETERAIHDALFVAKDTLEDDKIVVGGGAVEMKLSQYIRKVAPKYTGRIQLAINAYADALEVIPKALAENAGLDSIELLTQLRKANANKEGWFGIDIYNAKMNDMYKQNVFEPLRVKLQILTSSSEVARLLLRIDDVIASKKKAPAPPAGGMGGTGGMGGMPMGGMGGMPMGM